MITKIYDGVVVVEANGRAAGIYTIDSFTDEELKEQRAFLTGRLLYVDTSTNKGTKEVNNLHDLIRKVNEELDHRLLKSKGAL